MFNGTTNVIKCRTATELTEMEFLNSVFGNIYTVGVHQLKTSGFSGSNHERILLTTEDSSTISLILKHVHSSMDMTVWRTGTVADREVRLIESDELHDVWKFIECPYIAYAHEGDYTALLMRDLSPFLFPDLREPIRQDQEDLLLQALARVHARFQNRELKSASWLAKQNVFFDFLGPNSANEEKHAGRTHSIFIPVQSGWHLAIQEMPPELRSFVLEPPIESMMTGLPKTLIHGDCKLANFALLPHGKVSAFDWTVVAHASPAIEIGWYIAVNSSRLARTKEQLLARYREIFQHESGLSISNHEWQQMISVAVIAGARMLLWNKALNVQKSVAGAKEEWEWWIEHLAESKM